MTDQQPTLSEAEQKLVDLICDNPFISNAELAQAMGYTTHNISVLLGKIYDKYAEQIREKGYPDARKRDFIADHLCPKRTSIPLDEPTPEPVSPTPQPVPEIFSHAPETVNQTLQPGPEVFSPPPPATPQNPRTRNNWIIAGIIGALFIICMICTGGIFIDWTLGQLRAIGDRSEATIRASIPTELPAPTDIPTETNIPIPTNTIPPSLTPTITQTFTPSPTVPTNTPTITPTPTITFTPIPYLFRDDFEDGISPSWDLISGDYVVVDGALQPTDWLKMKIGDSSWVNYRIEFYYAHPEVTYSSKVFVRVQGTGDAMFFKFSGNDAWWFILQNGEEQVLTDRFGFDFRESTIRITVNGSNYFVEGYPKVSTGKFPNGGIELELVPYSLIDNFEVIALP